MAEAFVHTRAVESIPLLQLPASCSRLSDFEDAQEDVLLHALQDLELRREKLVVGIDHVAQKLGKLPEMPSDQKRRSYSKPMAQVRQEHQSFVQQRHAAELDATRLGDFIRVVDHMWRSSLLSVA